MPPQIPPQTPSQPLRAVTVPLDGMGDLLVSLRKEQKVIQQTLAQRLGVPQQTIARWEREKYRSASLENLVRVAQALNAEIYLSTKRAVEAMMNDATNSANDVENKAH